MSNRNFDFSSIVKILNAQNNANYYNRQQTVVQATSGIPYTTELQQVNPQTGNYDADTIATLQAGQQAYYFKGMPITTVLAPQQFTTNSGSGSAPAILPGPPTVTSAIAANNQLVVYFSPGSSGTNSIINYAYSLNGLTGPFVPLPSPQTTNPLFVPGLTNNTTYTIAIQAITQDGNSLSSNTVTGTPTAVPSPPVILSAITGIAGEVTLDFSQIPYYPDITNYQYSTDGGTSFTAFGTPVLVSPVTLTGLTPNTSYDIALKASTDTVTSASSNVVSAYIYTTTDIIQTFYGSSTWIAPTTTTVSYLVVGGGGGSGNSYDTGSAGGGGGGMVLTNNSYPVNSGTSYSIVVGAGGQGAPSTRTQNINGLSGTASVFDVITALGGNGGYGRNDGLTGRNGFGGAAQVSNTAAAIGGSGGGNNTLSPAFGSGGGGGGAGGAGTNGTGSSSAPGTGGSAGAGVSSSISGVSKTYGAGGRGGGSIPTGSTNGTSALSYSGSGANGGSAGNSSSASGGNGGSGTVVIRYS